MAKPQARKIRLAPNKARWVDQFKAAQVKGAPLYLSVSIASRYYGKLKPLIDQMHKETTAQLVALFKHPSFAEDAADLKREYERQAKPLIAAVTAGKCAAALELERLPMVVTMDASIASQARIITNKLTDKFTALFGSVAAPLATDTVQQTDENSASTLKGSLKDLSGGVAFKTDFVSEGVNDAITASVASNVDLIKRIPEEYMSDITGATMRSITLGNGLADLQPYLTKKYEGTQRQAQLMCMDQTRKAYTSINTERMKSVGVNEFEWVHGGGSRHPREYHANVLNGNTYSLDDPPIIDPKTGERGLPGQLPNCHCTMRPIVSFD